MIDGGRYERAMCWYMEHGYLSVREEDLRESVETAAAFAESEINRALDALAKDVEAMPVGGYASALIRYVLDVIAKHRPKDDT